MQHEAEALDLGGPWLAVEADDDLRRRLPDPDADDSGWVPVRVPGQWRSTQPFARSDGPLLYRRRFALDRPAAATRSWVTFSGIFYQADVWFDGSYLGDTEGYFAPCSFEVTDHLAAGEDHLLAVEVTCNPPGDRRRKRNLTGVFQHGDFIDPEWNPGGLWAPVALTHTGPVRIAALRTVCREAGPERASLDIEARIDSDRAQVVTIRTRLRRSVPGAPDDAGNDEEHRLATGDNRVRWRVTVEHPHLWWPRSLGDQPLYDLQVEVEAAGTCSDRRRLTTGLRRIGMRRFVVTVNGERLFLKGANLAPTRRALAEVTASDVERDLTLAARAGLDLLRVRGHIGHPELYAQADRAGMLLWQDLPLQWGYGQVRRQAVRQARQAVELLGHHPSVALWCGHNEPFALDFAPGSGPSRREITRFALSQALPTWNKTALDRSVRRALERTDGSRPVVAHSGVLPHPAWGTDTHSYLGWYHGEVRSLPKLLARAPVLGRFVGEFGAQAVPATDDFLEPHRWPDLDWPRLATHHGLQREIFERRVPPGRHPSLDSWRAATQQYQAELVRAHVETLRRLKYRPTGGFCVFVLADAQPAISWSLLDHERAPKAGYDALVDGCAPVVLVADPLQPCYQPGAHVLVALHAVSDLRHDLDDLVATARLCWPGGARSWRFGGSIPADSCVRVATLGVTLPPTVEAGPLRLDLTLAASDVGDEIPGLPRSTSYQSVVGGGPSPAESGSHRSSAAADRRRRRAPGAVGRRSGPRRRS
jgi:beta-mannosidase